MNFYNSESIRQFVKKFKSGLVSDSIFTSGLLIIVGLVAFFCGQLSVIAAKDTAEVERLLLCPETIEPMQALPRSSTMPITAAQNSDQTLSQPAYVASKNGTKFHHLTCPGASQIKESNKIFFHSPEEAERAGYTRAANCNR